jgi:CUB domain
MYSQVIKLNVNYINVSDWAGLYPDYVYIYDGANVYATVLGILYAPIIDIMPSYVSSQRNMLVRFISDSSTTYGGFNLSYSSIPRGTSMNRIVNKFSQFLVVMMACMFPCKTNYI